MAKCEFTELGLHLKVANVEKSLEFYESIGFEPTFAYGDKAWLARFPKLIEGKTKFPEAYRGAEFRLSEWTRLEIGEGHPGVKAGVFKETIKSPKLSAMIKVKSLLPLLSNSLVARELKYPISRYHWGSIEVAVRDPDGFVLVFIYQNFEPAVLDQHQRDIESMGFKVKLVPKGERFRA